MKAYQAGGYSFPDADTSFKFFTKENEKQHLLKNYYQKAFTQLPVSLKEKFIQTFLLGSLYPKNRTTYSQWKLVLQSTQKPPRIKRFFSDRHLVDDHHGVYISWNVENASEVLLNNKDVTKLSTKKIDITKALHSV